MGYSGKYDWKSAKDVREDVLKDWKESGKLLDSKTSSGGRHLWVAIESKTGERFVVLHLIEKHGNCWMEKAMSEDMGPYYWDCPLSLLELTEPAPKSEYSRKWREGVRKYHEKSNQSFDEGEKVNIYGKEFVVTGLWKKNTYLVKDASGTLYKSKAFNMDKVEG